MEIITETEAQILCAARFVLDDLSRRFQNAALDHANPLKGFDAVSCGRAAEASSSAADSIFDALNVASSHLDDPIAETYVQQRIDPATLETPFGGLPQLRDPEPDE